MTVLNTLEPEQVQSVESVESPGARLRIERQSQGLDQARVAAKLHLSESMIEALEWDDFNTLPGAVFAQGYLRNYARLLGIPEKEILDAYQRICPESEQGRLNSTASGSVAVEVRSSHGIVRIATWSIVIGLIVLLFIWWQGRLDWKVAPMVEAPSHEVSVQEQGMQEEDLLEQMPIQTFPAAESEQDTTRFAVNTLEPLPLEFQSEAGIEQAQSEMEPEVEQAEITTNELPSGEEPELLTNTIEEQLPIEQGEPIVEQVIEAQQEPQPVRELEFEFTDRCWVEVRDATGKAQIIGEMRAGASRTLDASSGPFRIVLGNAAVAKLNLDGNPFDLAPYITGNVARFTLDPTKY
jgi:cytoskeleton protein RodZ